MARYCSWKMYVVEIVWRSKGNEIKSHVFGVQRWFSFSILIVYSKAYRLFMSSTHTQQASLNVNVRRNLQLFSIFILSLTVSNDRQYVTLQTAKIMEFYFLLFFSFSDWFCRCDFMLCISTLFYLSLIFASCIWFVLLDCFKFYI